ncbi:MAG TPA: LysM domain-containing protein, partial [Burkholderiales bacterium]|nr:LysM domain-containing protein [Burkholderiales bacterium]
MPASFPQLQLPVGPLIGRLVLITIATLIACAPGRLPAAALDLWPVPGIVGALFQYEVRKGDTVTAISARFAVSERALIRDNALKPPYRLKPGDVLDVHNRHLVPMELSDGIVIN